MQAQMTENFPQSFHEYFIEMGNQHKYNAMGSKKKWSLKQPEKLWTKSSPSWSSEWLERLVKNHWNRIWRQFFLKIKIYDSFKDIFIKQVQF